MITQEALKEQLYYNPETGYFIRRVVNSRCVKVGEIAGCVVRHGYISIMVNNKSYPAHHLALLYMTGEMPKEVDHINHIEGDNRWVNLRAVTHQENQRNRSMNKNNSSGFNGVRFDNSREMWRAQIGINGVHKNLGRFKNIEDAIAARKAANIKYNYHPNHGK